MGNLRNRVIDALALVLQSFSLRFHLHKLELLSIRKIRDLFSNVFQALFLKRRFHIVSLMGENNRKCFITFSRTLVELMLGASVLDDWRM